MKGRIWIWALVLAIALAGPALAGKKCTHDAQECLDKMVANYSQHGWVGIELDKSGPDGLMTITAVEPDSPAVAAGLKKGDVLVALNGIAYKSENKAELKAAKKNMGIGDQIVYTIARSGHKKKVKVTLGEVPPTVLAQWVGRHMMEHSTVKIASN